ncbi:receptor-type tyrosine-protein phosphatase F-like [Argiope bruennichi]|uniref:receptor-type tyrosine-protein phosphatase F-like n=1 Tax=Argiope bruennichi TaxID=94029 RepID=UPI002494E37A|nr:receptor-type tyrosine-protein phosphatase F-like [Argiope bruennichi]
MTDPPPYLTVGRKQSRSYACANVPAPPLNLKVQEVESRTVNVSWSPPYTGNTDPITKYILLYWRDAASGGPHRLEEKVLNGNQTTALIENLDPGTNYQLVIAAENGVGRSEPSDIISFTTAEKEPSASPIDVNVEVKGIASLFVTWKPPPESEWNGKLKGFYVGYKSVHDSSQPYTFKAVDYVPGGVQESTITHLRNDTEYSIIVKAFNNAGTGPPSQDIVIRTSEGDVPTTPFELKVQEIWIRSVRVSWLVPHTGNNPNTKYVLQYWRNTVPGRRYRFEEKVIGSGQRSALIKDLTPATNYAVAIVAENDVGSGEPSHPISFTTSEDVPFDPPTDVNVDVKGTGTLVVTWKPPPKEQWNGKLKGFYVGYKMTRSYDPFSYKTVDYVPDGVQECTITHLHKNTEYSIIVQAFNKVGSGPPSHEVTIRTLGEEVPATPIDLKLQEVLDRTARISWLFPQTGNNSNTKFVVQYWRYTETGSRFRLKEEVVSSGQTSFLIQHLRPGTNYGLAILAENKVGQSEPSGTVLFATNEEEPSAPPTDINVDVNGTTSLLVTWKPPQKYEWNGKLKGFYVGYRITQSYHPFSYKTVDYVPDGVQEYMITDLLKNTEYSIRLKAFNKVGSGPASSDLVIRTLGEDVPATPVNLKVPEVWSRSVRVSWSSPRAGNNSNTKYVLQYWSGGVPGARHHLKEEVVNSGQTFLIKDLQPDTTYSLAIVAENEVGQSEPSDTILFTTNEEEPSESPTDVNVDVNGTSSLLVTWKSPPIDGWNGKLKGFYVGYKNMQDLGSYSFKTVDYVPRWSPTMHDYPSSQEYELQHHSASLQ